VCMCIQGTYSYTDFYDSKLEAITCVGEANRMCERVVYQLFECADECEICDVCLYVGVFVYVREIEIERRDTHIHNSSIEIFTKTKKIYKNIIKYIHSFIHSFNLLLSASLTEAVFLFSHMAL
jgi:hypothetical protein